VKAYFPYVQVSNKNLKRKKEVKPGELVTPNRALAMMELVRKRTRRQRAGALLVVNVPEDRAAYKQGEFLQMRRYPLKVLSRESPTLEEWRVAAVEVHITDPWVRNLETDMSTGKLREEGTLPGVRSEVSFTAHRPGATRRTT
jgi:hypothetical protein